MNVDPELALRATSERFVERVELAERLAADAGEDWAELDLEAQERWYDEAKTVRRLYREPLALVFSRVSRRTP